MAIFIVHCSGPKLVFGQYVNHQILDKLCLLPVYCQCLWLLKAIHLQAWTDP